MVDLDVRTWFLVFCLVFGPGPGAAQVQVAPGAQLEQEANNVEINFSEPRNFSSLNVSREFTGFEGSDFSVSAEINLGFEDRAKTVDVSSLDEATVYVNGPGGQSSSANPGEASEEDTEGGYGGQVIAELDLSETDTIQVYTGESPQNSSGGEGGDGWRDGGKTDTNGPISGGGGGASAVLNSSGDPIIVAGGGGGGWGWDTFTVSGGGGGAPCGSGGGGVFDISGSDAECPGTEFDVGGDGGGTDGDGGNFSATYRAEDGTGTVVSSKIVTDFRTLNGSGAAPDKNGSVVIVPGAGLDLVLDLYEPGAGRQQFVTNISAEVNSSQDVDFSLDSLPGEDFYEVFLRDGDGRQTSDRLKIGFTNASGEFNFSDTLTDRNYSVWYYGEKGVEISNVSFNRSDFEPVEGEPIGINQTITNEGAVEDEEANKTLRIQTFNGSDWETVEFRSTDIGVPIQNTETQQEFISRFRGSFENTTQFRTGGGQVGLGYQNGTPSDDLVGYWRLDADVNGDGGTFQDFSGNGHDATTVGGISTDADGLFSTDGVKPLDGGDYVTVDSTFPNLVNDFTISAWIIPRQIDRPDRGQRIFGDDEQNAGGYAFSLNDGGAGALRFFHRDVGGSLEILDTPNKTVENDKLYHVAAVMDEGNSMKIFVNGTLEASKSVSGQLGSDPGDAFIAGEGFENGQIRYFNGTVEEVRILKGSLAQDRINDRLYLNREDFRGSYVTSTIDNSKTTNWFRLNLDAKVPDETSLNMTYRALDSTGSLTDLKKFAVRSGDNFYNLENVQDSEQAEILFEGRSESVTKSWEIDSLQVISGGPYVDSFEARAGPFLANVTLDPDDEVKETNETNNRASSIINVDSYEFLFGGTDFQKFLADASGNRFFTWNPSNADGNIFVADKDLSFVPTDLEPLREGNYSDVDAALNLTGHNDSVSQLWDLDGDGQAEETESFDIGERTVSVPVTNSSDGNDGNFTTGIMYDASAGTPYDGSQPLVFVTEVRPGTSGSFSGTYDYEVRVPFSLGRQVPGVDEVGIVSEVR